jgi:hypothetical protein
MAFATAQQKLEWRRQYKLRYPEKHKAWQESAKARNAIKKTALKPKFKKRTKKEIKQDLILLKQVIRDVKQSILERDGLKWCSRCKAYIDINKFSPAQRKKSAADCKQCRLKDATQWKKNNPHKVKQTYKRTYQKKKSNPVSYVEMRIKDRITKAIKNSAKGITINGGRMQYLGCTAAQAVSYIESQMNKRMTWHNYGKAWHIDHIQPVAAYDLTKEDHRRKAFHYTNLQPLWAKTNMKKSDNITKQIHQPELIYA